MPVATKVEFSLVVPVLNEQEVLPSTYATLSRVLEDLEMPFEVVVVDNCSTDRTAELAPPICATDPRWKFIRFSRNFGYHSSITAGMLAARGEAIMVIDADLQDPPELIAQFVAKWQEGYDVVYGIRAKRTGESPLRTIPTMLAMRFISWMSDEIELPLHSGDFRLITRRVRNAFARMPESSRYVRGMIHWLGFRQIGIPYVRVGRTSGASKVDLTYLVEFTLNAVFNVSTKPLRMFSVLGLAILALTFVWAGVSVAGSMLGLQGTGIGLVPILLLVNLAIMSLGIGILGEYVARIFTQGKHRPLWLVDYTLNLRPRALRRVGGESRRGHSSACRLRMARSTPSIQSSGVV